MISDAVRSPGASLALKRGLYSKEKPSLGNTSHEPVYRRTLASWAGAQTSRGAGAVFEQRQGRGPM